MNKLRTLIVDDEPLIRLGLRNELARIEGVEILGECSNGAAAVDAIRTQSPDLVLLDVQMPDCTGLDVVRQIGPEHMPLVVFITAYDEYAVKAFEFNAVDYLLKPFEEDRLRLAIGRALSRQASRGQSEFQNQLRSLLSSQPAPWPERIAVKNGEHFEFVAVDSIEWIESANNYVQFHCGGKTYLLGETLNSMEARLDPRRFLRVHRRHIVNISLIVAIHPILNGSYQLQMKTGAQIATGRQHKAAVQNLLKS